MKPVALLGFVLVLALAACGADGPPTAPQSGIAITGKAEIGVSGGSGSTTPAP